MRRLAFVLLAFLLSFDAMAASAPRGERFAFHNGFLMNLHHFLVDAATLPAGQARPEWEGVAGADARLLREAASFYKTRYANSDLLFDEKMSRIKSALAADDARQHADGLDLPDELAGVLNRAAPAYARTLWPLHQRRNGRWIGQAAALDAVFGAELGRELARHFAHALPAAAVRVDVVYHSGTWAGAYTSESPAHIVIPSGRADYQGLAALEMLYHELAHTGANAALIEAIDKHLAARARPADTGLWHAVHFYTVGATVRQVFAGHAIAYQPYAERNGVFERGFAVFLPAIEAAWRPWLQGQGGFDASVGAMVDQLPAPR